MYSVGEDDTDLLEIPTAGGPLDAALWRPCTLQWHSMSTDSDAVLVMVGRHLERLTRRRLVSPSWRARCPGRAPNAQVVAYGPVTQTVAEEESHANRAAEDQVLNRVKRQVEAFYRRHSEIKASHGLAHVRQVHKHAKQAISCHHRHFLPIEAMQVERAALLHDVDDSKYFASHDLYENARGILAAAAVDPDCSDKVLEMIRVVSCSTNGNRVPAAIVESGDYYKLIPRWADRLAAVGAIDVVRCYQYNMEHGRPLSSDTSPRAATEADVWKLASPDRFEAYLASGGHSDDMISHYHDKLLHISRPPREFVRNEYREKAASKSFVELVEMCVRCGRTGVVDEGYVRAIAAAISVKLYECIGGKK